MPSIRVVRQVVGEERTERLVALLPCSCGAQLTLVVGMTEDEVFPTEVDASCDCGRSWSGYLTDPITTGDAQYWYDLIQFEFDLPPTVRYS